MPSGRVIEAYHRLEIPDAVGCLILNDKGEILLIESYRYPSDSVEWEFPAGLVDPGETNLQAVEREALEESGYQTTDHKRLLSFLPITGISGHMFHAYTCRAVEKVANPDPNEVRSTKWFSAEELRTMIFDGCIRDGITITALLLHLSASDGSGENGAG
jgi:ADP-ribose pyrophosphatase